MIDLRREFTSADDTVVTHYHVVFVNNFDWVMNENLFFFNHCSFAFLCWDIMEARTSGFSQRGRFVSLPWESLRRRSPRAAAHLGLRFFLVRSRRVQPSFVVLPLRVQHCDFFFFSLFLYFKAFVVSFRLWKMQTLWLASRSHVRREAGRRSSLAEWTRKFPIFIFKLQLLLVLALSCQSHCLPRTMHETVTVFAEIFVRTLAFASFRALKFSCSEDGVAYTVIYVYGFRMLLNFVLSAQRTKSTKSNRVQKFLRLQYK